MKVLVAASDKAELKAFSDRYIKVASGVGPFLSASVTSYAIAEHKPDVVFSVGSAGSFGSLPVGACISFGRVITPDQDLTCYHLSPGATLLPDGKTLREIVLDRNSGYVLSTSGAFATVPREGDAADMEGYGVALSAFLHSIPVFAVKVITDIVGSHVSLPEYGYTLRSLREKLPKKVEEIVKSL